MATVNSDDPAYFGGYINDNFIADLRCFAAERQHAQQLARNSFAAAFLDAQAKQAYLDEVDAFFADACRSFVSLNLPVGDRRSR